MRMESRATPQAAKWLRIGALHTGGRCADRTHFFIWGWRTSLVIQTLADYWPRTWDPARATSWVFNRFSTCQNTSSSMRHSGIQARFRRRSDFRAKWSGPIAQLMCGWDGMPEEVSIFRSLDRTFCNQITTNLVAIQVPWWVSREAYTQALLGRVTGSKSHGP